MNYKVSKHIDLNQQASWCPGCGHGIICRIITDAADKLGVGDRIVTVDDVACGQFGQYAMDYNSIMGAHGRRREAGSSRCPAYRPSRRRLCVQHRHRVHHLLRHAQ